MEAILKQLRLSKREIAICILLLKSGSPLKASLIAASIKQPRQTVYSIVTNLSKQGLFVRSNINGVQHFLCDQKQLAHYIDTEKRNLQLVKDLLQEKEVSVVQHTDRDKHALPKVQYYEGSVGLQRLFESILDFYKKGKSKRFRGYGINFLSDTRGMAQYLEHFIKKRHSYGVATSLFIAEGPDGFNITDDSRRYGRTVKKLNIDIQHAGIYLVGNRIYLFSYRDNVGIMIENQAIVQLLKDAFDDHWEKSPS